MTDEGASQLAERLDRRCPWCQRLMEPKVIETWKGKQITWPDFCGCEGEQESLALEKQAAEQEKRAWERRQWKEALVNAGL
ncbi:MAG: hypothetical protein ACFFDC_02675, partial [Promethearchaeota archaeon]